MSPGAWRSLRTTASAAAAAAAGGQPTCLSLFATGRRRRQLGPVSIIPTTAPKGTGCARRMSSTAARWRRGHGEGKEATHADPKQPSSSRPQGAPPAAPEEQQQQQQPPPSPQQPKAPAAKGGAARLLPKKMQMLAGGTARENIYTVPNLLTFSRLAAAPFVGWAILHDAHGLALGLFAYAGASDLLDGWIARRWGLQTVVGSVVDPMADKTLMTVLTVCLAIKGGLPVWLAAIILGRDVGLAIAAIYYRWISLPPPKTFARYWDFSLPSAEVRPTNISKYNTFLQLGLMGATMLTPVVAADVTTAMTAFQ
ncbi:hypothetical protein GGR56DRAFT_627631 [Xylariaceae sp. FL0804]|nr:hypothetical protein GGR56DRAFT_627631 [Xylariaceae sp. FL0804]